MNDSYEAWSKEVLREAGYDVDAPISDPVRHPPHYTDGPIHPACGQPIECIDITRDMNFCLGNAVKYLWRSGKKDPEKRVKDLEKARQYITFEIEMLTDDA